MLRTLLAFVMILTGGAIVAIYGPGVWKDYQLKQVELIEAPEYAFPDGGCENALIDLDLMFTCNFSLKDPNSAAVTEFRYFLYFPTKSARAVAMKTKDGSAITLAYGITHFTNRLITIVVSAFLALIGLLLLLKRRRV